MRFEKFLLILLVALSAQVGFAQTQPDNAVSPERNAGEIVHIFPNPAVEYVDVKLDHILASEVTIAVHNILGNPMEIESEVIEDHKVRVRVKDLATGYYLLAVKEPKTKLNLWLKFLKR